MDTTEANLEILDSIFHAALEISDPQERAAYLDAACGADSGLRERVEKLLKADGEAEGFFRTADVVGGESLDAKLSTDQASSGEKSGTRIGRYKLLQQIGEGGFGTVWMAEQTEPVKRKVALKIIKLGMDTREVIARFEAERQALAMMDHPNIAKVLDAGATEGGRPYFVMELVRGIPITEYCDEHSLSTRQRLELFVDICQAVQHAHQKGIIHRDLKPSNVMVTMHDDKAVPKVIDFGVAKATQTHLTDKTLFTRYEQFIGTPAYMSPEQAQLSGMDIDTRSDIYSLGVLLYELLTGNTPFDSKDLLQAGYDEIRRVIREEEPPKPSTRVNTLGDEALSDLARHRKASPDKLEGILRGDLDWIIMMALEKDRTRRYDTAIGLAKDIQNHLDDQPVTAAAPGALYRVRKYTRRHRTTLLTVGAIAGILVVAGGIAIVQTIRAWQTEFDAARMEQQLLAIKLKKERAEQLAMNRQLVIDAVADGDWQTARMVSEGIVKLEGPDADWKHNFDSMDQHKLATIYLQLGERELYEDLSTKMIEQYQAATRTADYERVVRVYFSVPRDPEHPQISKARQIVEHKLANVESEQALLQGFMQLAAGIAEFRCGNYERARELLSQGIETQNRNLQVSCRPYLAMTCWKLDDKAEAARYLNGARSALGRLESTKVDLHWHERVLGRLALEEAEQLIGRE